MADQYSGTQIGPDGKRHALVDVPDVVLEPSSFVRVYGDPSDGAVVTIVNGRPEWVLPS